MNSLSLELKIDFCYLRFPVFPSTSKPSIRNEFIVRLLQDSSKKSIALQTSCKERIL